MSEVIKAVLTKLKAVVTKLVEGPLPKQLFMYSALFFFVDTAMGLIPIHVSFPLI